MPILISDLDAIRDHAVALGFSAMRVTHASLDPLVGQRFKDFVDAGFAGEMDWLADTRRRMHPQAMWTDAKSALIVTMNYGPDFDPMARLAQRDSGVISVYALNRDYHDVMKGKLKTLAGDVARRLSCDAKVFVDTAPLMEKPLAAQAGLGWQGKHTNLVSRNLGSWLFLGVILTSADLPADEPETDHCGSCRACLDVCPTQAFPRAHVLDARRCISYLTIEHRGHIAPEFRTAMGNRIYGCDDCLAVCPWNKFAQQASEAKLVARTDLMAPLLGDLLKLDDPAFRRLFSGSPIKRIGRDRFVRNCLIAAGNSGDVGLVPVVASRLKDESPLVRAMAVWALKRLDPAAATHSPAFETDPAVIAEWQS